MKKIIDEICEKEYTFANVCIKKMCGIVNFFSSEEEKILFISTYSDTVDIVSEERALYGDWQTPRTLAENICKEHVIKYGNPNVVIEPTCGTGAFVLAALHCFSNVSEIYAIDINPQYTWRLKYAILSEALASPVKCYPDIYIYTSDFFEFDFSGILKRIRVNNWNVAIVGNPPWVTNSRQGKSNSFNIPVKTNKYGLKGIDAITGKSNFDISEYITLQMLNLLRGCIGGISFLLKNSVVRNIIVKQKSHPVHINNIVQENINAAKEFDVAVDASCLSAKIGGDPSFLCQIKDFYTKDDVCNYGWVGDSFVANAELYKLYSEFDGVSPYEWRSGVKHDCASVLELTLTECGFVNGLKEMVYVEEDMVFPLMKSSDISHEKKSKSRKYVIIPQRKMGENTSLLKYTHPLTYNYLIAHADYFSKRKSSIYKGKDRFSIFGVGEYSFKPYKIVVSSLYKTINFTMLRPIDNKPIIIDDTCYQLDFDTEEEAIYIYRILKSNEVQTLLKSLVFLDAKRVVTKSLLMRLDLAKVGLSNDSSIRSYSRIIKHQCKQLNLF